MQIIRLILGLVITIAIPLGMLKAAIYYSDKRNIDGEG
jgi:hypothetical protein